jgi:uncharacterized protein (TIGR03437 family)
MKLLVALLAAGPLFAQCTVSVSPANVNIDAGSPGTPTFTGVTITVTAPAGCDRPASSTVSWLHVTFGQTGTGSGTVGWTADRNALPTSRTGSIAIGNQTVTVTQAAAVCTYAVKPAAASIAAAGGLAAVQVQTGCSWGASRTQSWITLPPGVGGSSDGTINFTVAPNPCVSSRAGTIVVGLPGSTAAQYQTTYTLTQEGSPDNLTITPASLTLPAEASDGRIAINTGAGCAWSATSDVSWFQLAAPTSGSGSGFLNYRVAPNTMAARSGVVRIGARVIAVTQQAAALPVPQISAVTNAASGAQGAVSPGEIISIYGAGMGPSPGVPLQLNADGKSIAKSLGGVQVLFDGVPAALTFAGPGQVNAVVPYAVAGKPSTQMQVQYQAASNVVTLDVQDATPGIFTQDNSGLGLGAILNQNYSLNAPANRAAIGDTIQIYCTGGGVTAPASVDGSLSAAPFPVLNLPVTVTIGGVNARVAYKGAAPSLIAGLTQINAEVPPGVAPGAAVLVVVQVGEFKSQPGVTVAIQ